MKAYVSSVCERWWLTKIGRRNGIRRYACPPLAILLIPCLHGGCGSGSGNSPSSSSTSGPITIQSIQVTADVARYSFFADLWANTWADDDKVYFSFGDGTGLNTLPTRDGASPGAFVSPWTGFTEPTHGCFHIPPAPANYSDPMWGLFCRTFDCATASACCPITHFTDSGLAVMNGSPPNFNRCPSAGCMVDTDVPNEAPPSGQWRNDDKVSSLLYVNSTLYFAGHSPSGTPTQGYIAASTNKGKTWKIVQGTPWTGNSPFRVLMFINMGQNYQLNTDGYVYAMGTPLELEITFTNLQSVYLARVPVGSIGNYSAYQYLKAVDQNDAPTWSSSQADAISLSGLSTFATGSAIYHSGTKHYLFLAGVSTGRGVPARHGTLFAAPEPWGPWSKVGEIPGSSISMLISKGAGPTSVYFTAAGGTDSYNLNIGRIDMKVSN